MTLPEIVREWLRKNGYNGLINRYDDCKCTIYDGDQYGDEFMSCGNYSNISCEAYKFNI